ncbi:type I secretion system permease/ATPase, partial [Serratia ureilytica]
MKNAVRRGEVMSVLAAYRRGFWGIALFTAVINLLMLAPALYMLQVYDRVLPSGNRMTLAMLTLMVVGLYLFMGLLEWVRSQVVIRLGAQMDMRLNQRVYDAAFETNLKTGNPLAGQALNDLTNLRQFATGNALFAFFDAPWFPVYLLVVFLLHPWLGALASAGVIVLVLLAWLNQRVSQAPLAEAGRVALSATQQANGNLRNAEAIAAMGMLTDLRLRWLRQHQQFLLLQNRASEKIAAVTAWSKTVRLALQSLMLGCGALLAVSGDITPGMMIAGSILIGRVLGPIDQLIGAWKQWSSARQSLHRLEVMLAANPPQTASLPLPAPNGTLTVNQLSASAPGGSAPVLHGVSFRLEAGEVLGVIGASGSGKTLLMRQLVGALTPLSGDVRLDGADLRQWDKQQLGPHIGYLPQDIQLFAGTLTENIARFGQVDAEKVVAAAALAGV